MVGRSAGLLLAWSRRDLRARWLQVAAVALIIALGSGFYSGLSSTSTWRRESYGASFRALGMFDLHMTLPTGGYVRQGELIRAVRSIPKVRSIAAAEERLVGPTQVDASTGGKTILVPGRVVGLRLADGGPRVTRVAALEGRPLRPSDAGRAVGLLDVHFGRHYDLPPAGKLRLSGGDLRYVGFGVGPEHFVIVGEQQNVLAEANFAVVFTSLETAQRLLGRPGEVNDLVLRLEPGADAAAVGAEISSAMRKQLPGVGFELTPRAEDTTYRLLYRDIDFTTYKEKCPVTERACYHEAVWLEHRLLLGTHQDMDDIAAGFRKVKENLKELRQ